MCRQIIFSAVLIIVASYASADNESDLKCLVSYLRRNDINEEILSSVDSTEKSALCDQVIDSNMLSVYSKLKLDEKAPKFATCIKNGINESGLKNIILLSEAVKMFDVGWKIWKDSERVDRANRLSAIANDAFEVLQTKCFNQLTMDTLGEDFDKVIYLRKDYRGDQEFCVRKHLAESGILSRNVALNPQSINENVPDCSFIVSGIQERTYKKMEQHTSSCVVNSFRQDKYVDYYMKIELVLPKLGLTPETIAKERTDFIEKIYSFKEKAKKLCAE